MTKAEKEAEKAQKIAEKEAVKANKTATNGAEGSTPKAVGKTGIKAEKVLVWLKGKAYVNDTEMVKAGLYLLDKCPDRLAKLPTSVCEVLSTEVNSRKIAEIARWSGMNPDGVSDEEILSKCISPTFAPFS